MTVQSRKQHYAAGCHQDTLPVLGTLTTMSSQHSTMVRFNQPRVHAAYSCLHVRAVSAALQMTDELGSRHGIVHCSIPLDRYAT